ncbi:amidohydrolase family protein [bacterium]|nr:amidohydrolase family protein [bacterium]
MTHEIDLLLKGAFVVDPVNRINGIRDIAIAAGKIADVSRDISPALARQVKYLSGTTAIPGIIDSHVHASPLIGGFSAHKMLARAGVTTAFEVAGPVEGVWKMMAENGAGLNLLCIHAVAPGLTIEGNNPSRTALKKLLHNAVSKGAIGIKVLGGHLPLTPDATRRCIELARQEEKYCAFHAGTTRSGSNFDGFLEALDLAEGNRLHLAHINSYCRGQIKSSLSEASEAISALETHPHIFSESYLSPLNGTSGRMIDGQPFSKATPNSLKRFGYSPDFQGMKQAITDGVVSIMVEEGDETVLQTGSPAVRKWEAADTNLNVSFDINPADSRFLLATARNRDGRFTVDAIATDGGGIPRNVIVENGLALVDFKALTMADFVLKTSANPAAMLGLTQKGSLSVGADADITVLDLEKNRACMSLVGGRIVMVAGHVCGSGGTALVLPEGEKHARKLGLGVDTIDPDHLFQRLDPHGQIAAVNR